MVDPYEDDEYSNWSELPWPTYNFSPLPTPWWVDSWVDTYMWIESLPVYRGNKNLGIKEN